MAWILGPRSPSISPFTAAGTSHLLMSIGDGMVSEVALPIILLSPGMTLSGTSS